MREASWVLLAAGTLLLILSLRWKGSLELMWRWQHQLLLTAVPERCWVPLQAGSCHFTGQGPPLGISRGGCCVC